MVILTSIDPILEKCVHMQVQFLYTYFKASGRSLLWNLQVLWQYSRILHLQVTTFFKYWVNTRKYYHNTYEYCHNTCEYWGGEYTLRLYIYQNWFHVKIQFFISVDIGSDPSAKKRPFKGLFLMAEVHGRKGYGYFVPAKHSKPLIQTFDCEDLPGYVWYLKVLHYAPETFKMWS